ncbi:hypothetical protein G9387_06300 [Enterobacter hormaechei]|uniref:hypothetical protein n=1 Tax=Enterobacter hormaechei TaxID=158836 RepID=UPI0013EFBDFB|nr:hypothetical protein [Enterobacter hormaechei]KAF6706049.1 hypothetical protein G9393_07430 [Enterobacter hormaechei]KAF6712797.1 hypothetical protein G9387_06300 [Enterobacter hormaechei]
MVTGGMGGMLALSLRLHECPDEWLLSAAGGVLALAGYPLLRRFRVQCRHGGCLHAARRCIRLWGAPLCFTGVGLFLVLFSGWGGQSGATVVRDEADTRCERPEKSGVVLAAACRPVARRGGAD